jgi:hypothetical protein
MDRFSPSDAALEGFRLTRERPLTILAWTGYYFLGLTILFFAMFAVLGPSFRDMLERGDTSEVDAMSAILAKSPQLGPILILAVFFNAIMVSGVFRLVLRPEDRGWAWLRVGMDELRLTLVVLFLPLFIAAAVAFIDFAVVMVAQMTGAARYAPVIVAALALCITLWIGVRLSLAAPATFVRRKISIGESWRITRGHFWSLSGMIVLSIIFWIMVLLLIVVVGYAVVALAGGVDAMENLQSMTPATVFALVFTYFVQILLLPVLQIVMIGGPLAIAYRRISGMGDPDPAPVEPPAVEPA